MPIVRIDVVGPKTPAYKSAVLAGVRRAVTTGFAVPDERVTVRIVETGGADVDLPSCRTERFTVIEVTMYEGRTADLKAAMAAAAREALAADPGIEASEIQVAFIELSRENLDVPPGQARS